MSYKWERPGDFRNPYLTSRYPHNSSAPRPSERDRGDSHLHRHRDHPRYERPPESGPKRNGLIRVFGERDGYTIHFELPPIDADSKEMARRATIAAFQMAFQPSDPQELLHSPPSPSGSVSPMSASPTPPSPSFSPSPPASPSPSSLVARAPVPVPVPVATIAPTAVPAPTSAGVPGRALPITTRAPALPSPPASLFAAERSGPKRTKWKGPLKTLLYDCIVSEHEKVTDGRQISLEAVMQSMKERAARDPALYPGIEHITKTGFYKYVHHNKIDINDHLRRNGIEVSRIHRT